MTPNHIRCSIVPGKACQKPVIPLFTYIFFAKPIGEVYVGILDVENRGEVEVLWNCICSCTLTSSTGVAASATVNPANMPASCRDNVDILR